MRNEDAWARTTFGGAELGDRRRVERLVLIAKRAAAQPTGTVTGVFKTSAEQEGAFRLLESDGVTASAVQRAMFGATARACAPLQRIYVPIDGSSLSLTDVAERRELGRVGSRGTRGLEVMSALAVDEGGRPFGLLDQRWWARDHEPRKRDKYQSQCINNRHLERETRFWLETLTASEEHLADNAPETRAWYQMDRGADCWPLFQHVLEKKLLATVRSNHNRRVVGPDGPAGKRRYLRQELERQHATGGYTLEVPRRGGSGTRRANIALRACKVKISARISSNHRKIFEFNAVMVRETQRRPDRICWVLLTTHPIKTRKDIKAVVRGYALRWRIEDFHRAWKRGHCNVEKTQLRDRSTIVKWATILAAVAARALHLAHLLRTNADLPASTEFTEHEIEACFILSEKARDRRKSLSVGDVLKLIAELGGFGNRYYGGKLPGPTVIGRGLKYMEPMA
ncbi:MAG TPA: IS4 family transposase, partial [Polyangiaceae bacterium]|nr:IS4 family transposase [Polyangiaceae bacterium]